MIFLNYFLGGRILGRYFKLRISIFWGISHFFAFFLKNQFYLHFLLGKHSKPNDLVGTLLCEAYFFVAFYFSIQLSMHPLGMDQLLLARKALECKEYSRALLCLEAHCKGQSAPSQAELPMFGEIYAHLNDTDALQGVYRVYSLAGRI